MSGSAMVESLRGFIASFGSGSLSPNFRFLLTVCLPRAAIDRRFSINSRYLIDLIGERDGIRTHDLLIKRQRALP
jgi:hypothetical protein